VTSPASEDRLGPWWSTDAAGTATLVASSAGGLSSAEARLRLARHGGNELKAGVTVTRLGVLFRQLRNPLLLLLVFAALASALTQAWIDAAIVLTIVVVSSAIGYTREYAAQRATLALRQRIQTQTTAIRDGIPVRIPARELVPGDVVLLSPGSLVPADLRLLDTTDCFVNEAALTGESFPVEKSADAVAAGTPIAARACAAWLGSNVRSGTARGLVVATGNATEYGAIAARLAERPVETEFDHALRRFGYLLTTTMLLVVLIVFAANVLLGRPPIDTLMFSIALAVGLSPELLPAILSINLARGSSMMARHGVLVRHLNAIENLGSMDILCTDKTGTLTEGVVELEGAFDAAGEPSPGVLELARRNATLQAGLPNPLDQAIVQAAGAAVPGVEKVAEIPYDFARKRVGVIVREHGELCLITKGAFDRVLDACTAVHADLGNGYGRGELPLDDDARARLRGRYEAWTAAGIRVLAVATRRLAGGDRFGRDDEHDLTFAGFLTFLDRPKEAAAGAVADLAGLGVRVKVISGDSRRVVQHVAGAVGIPAGRTVTGAEVDQLSPAALTRVAEEADLFAEVDPNQKERIIRALRQGGHVVGFLGDGVNDAPAMHAADTSLSVDQATDVAKEAADFVLLERDLHVIRRGVEAGRRTFANTLKYVLTTTSANLGNMLSMAVASLMLPFLPLLAGQILLNNFLSDIPAIGIADDHVDPEMIDRPRRWSMRFIARFMIQFGALSSLFDFLTFGLLLVTFAAGPELFRTGWFVESLLTELVIALVVRTYRPLHRSRPGRLLLVSTMILIPLTFAIPFVPHAALLGFVPLPPGLMAALVGVTVLYVAAAELLKRRVFRRDPRVAARRREDHDEQGTSDAVAIGS